MANIDFQLLRDWYNSNYYTGIPLNLDSGRSAEARKTREFWTDYVQSRPLELDPRVKYRIANKEAIDEFDRTGQITGTTTYSSLNDIPAVYFSQGQPLHQYAKGSLTGGGTALKEQQPYLIATLGNDWGSSASVTGLTQDQISRSLLTDSIYDRVDEDAQGAVRDARYTLEQIRREVPRIRTQDQFERLFERIDELQETYPNFSSAIERHIFGAPAKGYYESASPDLETYYGLDDAKRVLTNRKHWIPDSFDELEILKDGYYARGLADGGITKATRDLMLADIDKALNGMRGVEDTLRIDPKIIKQFEVYPAGQFSSGRNMYAIPDFVDANQRATSLLPSDTELFEKIASGKATPEEIEKVYGLGALQDWRGGGGSNKTLFINNPNSKSIERVGNIIPTLGASMGAMSSEVLPRTLIEDSSGKPTWSITSPSVEVGNYRPFAIWQYTKNGLRLINQGNNEPVVGGVKPIPTGRVDSDLIRKSQKSGTAFRGKTGEGLIDFFGISDEVAKDFGATGSYFHKWQTQEQLAQMQVKDAIKRFDKMGWRRGFVDFDGYTAPFTNVASSILQKDPYLGAMEYGMSDMNRAARIAETYADSSANRALMNAELANAGLRTIGKVGTAAAIGLAPYDALSRRELNFTDFYNRYRRDPTYEENMGLRIQSGVEPILNLATFGMYDALAETPTYKAYLDYEAKDLGRRKVIQAGIDYPMIGGYQVERTTR